MELGSKPLSFTPQAHPSLQHLVFPSGRQPFRDFLLCLSNYHLSWKGTSFCYASFSPFRSTSHSISRIKIANQTLIQFYSHIPRHELFYYSILLLINFITKLIINKLFERKSFHDYRLTVIIMKDGIPRGAM